MSYLSALQKNIIQKEQCISYLEAFKKTTQKPNILKNSHKEYCKSYVDVLCKKKEINITDIPYYKPKNRSTKKIPKKSPTRIPKFLVFILLPFFNKLSSIYKVLLPDSFIEQDFYSCTVCHLVSKFWKSSGCLTTYKCKYYNDSWIFKTACCKKCSKIGNKLELKERSQ